MMKTSPERKRKRADLYFVFPSMTISTVFVFIPLIIIFISSFFKFDMMFQDFQSQELDNHAKLASDKKFWNILFNTVYYVAFTVPVQIGLTLVTTTAVKREGRLNGFFKSVYFIPAICSVIIVSILWSFLANPDIGVFCYRAKLPGFNPINVLSNSTRVAPMVILANVWGDFGLNMIILLAGLNGTDESYYEAANIDGATGFRKFRGITIPMLISTLSSMVVDCTIGSFQVFDQVCIMTKGGSLLEAQTLVQLIYSMAFDLPDMGYTFTIATALFIITLIISVFTFKYVTKGEEDLG